MKKYLVINNISKKNNVWQLIRTAEVYSYEIILVGAPNIRSSIVDAFPNIKITFFDKINQMKDFLIENNLPLIGIEIDERAQSVHEFQFPKIGFALMPGNEGTGLSEKQKNLVDYFVFLPQYGTGTASLNVFVATTLIMHQDFLNESEEDSIAVENITAENISNDLKA